VSFGGQHRLRYEYTAPAELGASIADSRESVLFSRNLLHAAFTFSLTFASSCKRAHSSRGRARSDVPPGTDQLDVTQAFLETSDERSGVHITARVGRQEMGLGSTRWVSVRDPTNVRRSFDMARVSLSGKGWSSHTFSGLSPKLQRGVFDDAPDEKNLFWAPTGRSAIAPDAAFSIDAFYLGRSRPAVYREESGREVRHTFGIRAFGKFSGGFEYIAPGSFKSARSGDADVLAWGTSATAWQRLPGPLEFAARRPARRSAERRRDSR